MPAGGLATSGLGLLLGAGEAAWGYSEKKKYQGQIDATNANRPKYQINPEENNIVNLAESRANQGMGGAAKQALQNNTDRSIASLSNAALMGGADANSIGNLVDKSQQSYNQNAIYDDTIRLQNLDNLQSSWARMSADRDKAWQLNELNPWKDRMAALSGQLTGANNMFLSGLNMGGSSLMSGVGKLGSLTSGASGGSGGGGGGAAAQLGQSGSGGAASGLLGGGSGWGSLAELAAL